MLIGLHEPIRYYLNNESQDFTEWLFEANSPMSSKMNIAHFTNTNKPNVNGVVRSVSTFREALIRMGHLIFCFASITETQGLVMMEAMAADLPVVAVDAAGIRDEGDNGVQGLLTDNDSQALAQALQKVLDDEILCARLKAGAKEKAKTFDMMLQAKKMIAVYEQAIEDKKANRYVLVDSDRVKAKMKER